MKIGTFAFVTAFLVSGCGGAKSAPLTPVQTARASARAAVTVAASGFVLAANACLAATEADPAKSAAIAKTCVKYLDPAHDLIAEAAKAVDGDWSLAVACDLVQAVTLVSSAMTTLGLKAPSLSPVLQDAATLAVALAGPACAPDAGAADAGSDAGAE